MGLNTFFSTLITKLGIGCSDGVSLEARWIGVELRKWNFLASNLKTVEKANRSDFRDLFTSPVNRTVIQHCQALSELMITGPVRGSLGETGPW